MPCTHTSAPLSPLHSCIGTGGGQREGEEKKKRRNEPEWDRARAAPGDLEAVYDANMYKSSALPPLRKEPKIEV